MLHLELQHVEILEKGYCGESPRIPIAYSMFCADFFRENGYTATLEGNLLTLACDGTEFRYAFFYKLEGIDWHRRSLVDNDRFYEVINNIVTLRLHQLVKYINRV